jgi:carboxymethylenebutenolidase
MTKTAKTERNPRRSSVAQLRLAHRLLAATLVACGCSKPSASGDQPHSAATQSPAAQTPAPAAPARAPVPKESKSLTGLLSEEQFKKLHELKAEQAPPRRGVMIDISGQRAYLSLPPEKPSPLPALIVIHEWWGLNEHIMHWTDRLADDGYAALAVDLYGGKVATTPDEAMATMKTVDASRAQKTLSSAHDFLEKDPRVRASRTGVIGWCFGGKWSLELALAEADLDAVVVYYGHVTTDAKRLAALRAPLFGVFANKDKAIPPSMVDEFETNLKGAGKTVTIARYDADHAFANPSGQRYDEAAAKDAWQKVRAFLEERLKRGG